MVMLARKEMTVESLKHDVLDIMKEFEWSLHLNRCPRCESHRTVGHKSGCKLEKLLKDCLP